MDLTQRDQLIQYLKMHGLWAKKSLGQNFLVDREALDKIVEAAEITPEDTVLEIGPGLGVLTEELVARAGKVVALEKDDKLSFVLNHEKRIIGKGNIKILNEDALDFDPTIIIKGSLRCGRDDKIEEQSENKVEDSSSAIQNDDLPEDEELKHKVCNLSSSYKLVANIPYYITSKILEKFLSSDNKPSVIVILVQKEVAERICAKAGNLSVLAISVQYFGEPEIIGVIKRDSFFPAPEVDSAIIRIRTKKGTIGLEDEKAFFKMVKLGFVARRKTLYNNLKSGTSLKGEQIDEILDEMGISRKARAQELSIQNWIDLTEKIKSIEK